MLQIQTKIKAEVYLDINNGTVIGAGTMGDGIALKQKI